MKALNRSGKIRSIKACQQIMQNKIITIKILENPLGNMCFFMKITYNIL